MSKKFFINHFYQWMELMKDDKVMGIRRRFSLLAAQVINRLFCIPKRIPIASAQDEDKNLRFELIDALDTLKNDMDDEVAEAAFEAEVLYSKYNEITEEEFLEKQ